MRCVSAKAGAPLRLLFGGGRSGISAQLGSSRVSGLAILRSAPATAGRTRRAERPVPLRALGFIPPGSPAPSPRLEPLHGASGSRRGLGAVSRTTASPPPHRALDPERPPLQRGLGKHTPGLEGAESGAVRPRSVRDLSPYFVPPPCGEGPARKARQGGGVRGQAADWAGLHRNGPTLAGCAGLSLPTRRRDSLGPIRPRLARPDRAACGRAAAGVCRRSESLHTAERAGAVEGPRPCQMIGVDGAAGCAAKPPSSTLH